MRKKDHIPEHLHKFKVLLVSEVEKPLPPPTYEKGVV